MKLAATKAVTFREIARAVYAEMGRLPPEARLELAASRTYDPVFGTTTSATHIAAVEIDPQTLEIDYPATDRLRASMRKRAPVPAAREETAH